MTSGVQSQGVDLDSIFDAFRNGQTAAAVTGCQVNGTDLNARYAPLSAGSAAAVTGIESKGADLNTIFAKIGTSGGLPHADYTYTTNALAATFTDISTDPGGTIGSWAWTFGDGGTSTAQNPSHTFASANTYNVTLTVTDSRNGKTSSMTHAVNITSSQLGFSGVTYESAANNLAQLTLSFPTTSTWSIAGAGTVTGSPLSGSLTTYGAVTEFYLSNVTYNGAAATVVTAPQNSWQPITAGLSVFQYKTTGLTGNAVSASATLQLRNSSGQVVSTNTINFEVNATNPA
ncbi:MAG: PKD domain-containing protein [Xanthomonadaceae bacterium]|nr:PKD domain-containing protein [Xanthomonadaceae bacterium]